MRSFLGAALLAVALLLGACTGGAAPGGSVPASSTGAPTTAEPLEQDASTWFTAYCSGLVAGAEYLTRKPNEGQSPRRQKETVSRNLASLAAVLDTTGGKLATIPPPADGDLREWAAGMPAALKAASKSLKQSLQAYDAADVKDVARFRKVEATLAANLQKILQPFALPKEYARADVVRDLPACRPLTGAT